MPNGGSMQQVPSGAMPQPSMPNINSYPQNFPQLDIDTQNNDDLRLLDEIISK